MDVTPAMKREMGMNPAQQAEFDCMVQQESLTALLYASKLGPLCKRFLEQGIRGPNDLVRITEAQVEAACAKEGVSAKEAGQVIKRLARMAPAQRAALIRMPTFSHTQQVLIPLLE